MKVIIIGGGQTGAYIANILLSNKCEVTVIENREHIIAKLKREIPEKNILFGNGTDPNILEQAGIDKAEQPPDESPYALLADYAACHLDCKLPEITEE